MLSAPRFSLSIRRPLIVFRHPQVPYSTFVLYTSVAELRTTAAIPLDEALQMLTIESRNGIEVLKTAVGPLPEVFTLGFSWDTAKPTKSQLDTLLEQVSPMLLLV